MQRPGVGSGSVAHPRTRVHGQGWGGSEWEGEREAEAPDVKVEADAYPPRTGPEMGLKHSNIGIALMGMLYLKTIHTGR